MASLYFKWIFPDCRIIAFEPNPSSFALLEKNIKENRLEKLKYYNVGFSDKIGKMLFYIDNSNPTTLRGSIKKGRGGLDEIMVQFTKFSEYIAKYESVDLRKMDVEGAEFEIVKELSSSGSMK
jgi:FkbM family methyltransferase|tara:strand:- start:2408 stop:2776 length:369 start_codon:yes stop_codon:yes gene_type:complete